MVTRYVRFTRSRLSYNAEHYTIPLWKCLCAYISKKLQVNCRVRVAELNPVQEIREKRESVYNRFIGCQMKWRIIPEPAAGERPADQWSSQAFISHLSFKRGSWSRPPLRPGPGSIPPLMAGRSLFSPVPNIFRSQFFHRSLETALEFTLMYFYIEFLSILSTTFCLQAVFLKIYLTQHGVPEYESSYPMMHLISHGRVVTINTRTYYDPHTRLGSTDSTEKSLIFTQNKTPRSPPTILSDQ